MLTILITTLGSIFLCRVQTLLSFFWWLQLPQVGHYQNNCLSYKNCKNQPYQNSSKLKTPDLHLKINLLKQEIKEIKPSNFQITKKQLAQ